MQMPGMQRPMKKANLQRPGLQNTPGALQKQPNLQIPDCLKKPDSMPLSRPPEANISTPETPSQEVSTATDEPPPYPVGHLNHPPDSAGHASDLHP